MEDTKEVENGLTVGDVFKIIFKRIWWVLGATLVCLAVLLMITELWYNKREQYYSISYDIVYPDIASGKYPDGSDLIVSDSISHETLTDIKNGVYSKENPDEFKNIDVDNMYSNDGISVSDKVVKGDGGNVKVSCTLTVKAKYFGSVTQARTFLRTVAEYPVNRVKSAMTEKDHVAHLTGYNDAPTYDEKISALTSQKNYLESEYTKLSAYGEKAAAGIASLRNIFTASQQSEIKSHITAFKYVLSPETYKDGAAAEIAALNKQIEDNKKIIAELRTEQSKANTPADGTPVVTDPYEERIAAIIENSGKLKNRIDEINETLAAIEIYTAEGAEKDAKQAFDKRIDDIRIQLEQAAQTLKSVSVSIYSDNSRTVFSNNKLEKEGGIHWAISAVLGALLGLVVSSIVVYFVGVSKYKREKFAAAQNGASGVSSVNGETEPETVVMAEAAASDDVEE